MPARWMEGKLAKMKRKNLRFVEKGSAFEARHCDRALTPMPENKHQDDQTIAAYYARGGKVRREPCKGRMPSKSYGRVCKGHTRQGLNLNYVSERTVRERPHDFAPQGLLNWAPLGESRLIKVTR